MCHDFGKIFISKMEIQKLFLFIMNHKMSTHANNRRPMKTFFSKKRNLFPRTTYGMAHKT